MTLYFITSNEKKFAEVKKTLPTIERIDIDLPEIQHLDPKEIVKAKLSSALEHKKEAFIVEDTSLSLDAMHGLPGPFIKWFIRAIKAEGLFSLAEKFGNTAAEAKTVIGYAKNVSEIHYFEGVIRGHIVSPVKTSDPVFGWDNCFKPEGYDKTFGEMSQEAKHSMSMRSIAVNKLKKFLDEKA